MLGVIAYVADDYGRALAVLSEAHEIDPDGREIADIIAQVHTRAGNLNDGVYFAKLASIGESNPLLAAIKVPGLSGMTEAINSAEAKTYLNDAYRALSERRFEDAVDLCARQLRLRDGDAPVFKAMGEAMLGIDAPDRALDTFMAAVHLDAEDPEIHLGLGIALSNLGERERAFAAFARALDLAGNDVRVASRVIAEATAIDPSREMTHAVEWPRIDSRIARLKSTSGAIVKIGYLTDAACNIDEMRVLESLLIGHDRDLVTAVVFSADVPGDGTAARLKGYAASWHDIREFNDGTIVDWMGVNDLDALIDLTFRPDGQRPGVLMSNPAPCVIGVFGPKPSIFSAGYDRILRHKSFISSDKRSLPVDAPLIAVDPSTMPQVSDTNPATENGFVTFGATLDLRQLTPAVASVFAAVLRAKPESRLMLGSVYPVSDQARQTAMSYFADNGVVDRVDIRNDDADKGQNLVYRRLAMMVRIDVYLEAFPITPLMPAVDALWAGVPVIAMDGDSVAGANTPGVLRGAGMGEWVASDTADYVRLAAKAASLAEDQSDRKAAIARNQSSPVFDPRANAKAFEEAVRSL